MLIDGGLLLVDGSEVVQLADLPEDVEIIAPLEEALARAPDAKSLDPSLFLRAADDTPVHVINAVVGTARAVGYTSISLCPSIASPSADCRRIVITR